ncbi:MAG TPA: hypothetical protein VIC02_03825 [Kineobactrum sp.]
MTTPSNATILPPGNLYACPEQATENDKNIKRLWTAITLLNDRIESQAREIKRLRILLDIDPDGMLK